jgi:uncharacterized protein (TIGR02145 family)
MRAWVLAAVSAWCGVAGVGEASAQDLAKRLVGAWRLVSTEQRLSDGTSRPSPLYGPNGVGYLMYSESGRMCAVLMDPSRARWKLEDAPTEAELRSSLEHFVAYCGRYDVDERDKSVVHHVEMDLVPNALGIERKRYASLEGNRLELRPAEPMGKDVVEYTLTWERVGAADVPASSPALAKRMPDGKEWTVANLDVDIASSYCYGGAEPNCSRYGRLYTWEAAARACVSLGEGWRLPSENDWRQLAKQYGGVSEDSIDGGRAAYKELSTGGASGLSALLGGGRGDDGQYARLEAHGFYWTASEIDPGTAWFYNFASGGAALHRQDGGEKRRAFSVRCVRE